MKKTAIIDFSGRQYKVLEGDVIKTNVKDGFLNEGDSVTFDKVLLIHDEKDSIDLGNPYIKGKSVIGKVTEIGKDKKISVVRFRSKSNYKKHKGHRQPICKIQIEKIA